MNVKENIKTIRCVVIEDELNARTWLIERLQEFSEIEIVGQAGSVNKGYDVIVDTKPDAVFLDIKLTGGSAFSILDRLRKNGFDIPYVVITTGFPDYAAQAINDYSRYVLKYIMKPFTDQCEVVLRDAIDAIIMVLKDKEATNIVSILGQDDFVMIRNVEGLMRIDFQAIKFITALGKGRIAVFTDSMSKPIDMTLVKFLELLPRYFKQVSKTHAINMNMLYETQASDRTLTLKGYPLAIGIGDVYYAELQKILERKRIR